MGILDNDNKYYYFKLRNGVAYEIKVTIIHINTTINRNYLEMTEEQKTFYLENPTASVWEVVNCHLNPPYVPPAQDVTEYANICLKNLKDACYNSVSVSSLEYAMANAVLAGTSLTYTGEKYYSITEAKSVMKTFMDESYAAMTLYDRYKTQILAASDIENIDSLYDDAIAELNGGNNGE